MRSKSAITVFLALLSGVAQAGQLAVPAEPSVEDNIRAMDKDHDGIVTVYEVRAFIEARHGKGYKQEALDEMESSARGKSCSTPFAKSLY